MCWTSASQETVGTCARPVLPSDRRARTAPSELEHRRKSIRKGFHPEGTFADSRDARHRGSLPRSSGWRSLVRHIRHCQLWHLQTQLRKVFIHPREAVHDRRAWSLLCEIPLAIPLPLRPRLRHSRRTMQGLAIPPLEGRGSKHGASDVCAPCFGSQLGRRQE